MPIIITPPAEATEVLEIDPVSEDANNSPLLLEDSDAGYRIDIAGIDWGNPDRKQHLAGSADTLGDGMVDSGFGNRTIVVPVRCSGTSAASLDTAITALQEKVGKLQREQGTLKRTTAGGNSLVFEVLDADIDVPLDWHYVHSYTVVVTLKFLCLPPGWGDEVQVGTFTSLGGGVYHAVCTGIEGDFPARGRALFTEGSAVDQWHVHWGVRSRYYGTATTESVYYEAESCLPQGGAVATSLSGASGGSAVYQGTLTTSYQSMLSLASSGTVYKQHIGDYNLWTRLNRPTANAGTVSVALEWAEGDFTRFTRNTEVVFDADEREGDFTIANLGQVHLSKAKKGSQRWDGHIIAKSTTLGDDLYVDDWWLQPISESAGEVTAATQLATPTAYAVRDEFDQSAGNLNGKTLPVGGTWATSGADATDLAVEASGHTVQRSTTSDGSGKTAIAGSGTLTNTLGAYDFKFSAATASLATAFQLRYTDANNRLAVVVLMTESGGATVSAETVVGGSGVDILRPMTVSWIAAGNWYTITALCTASGTLSVWIAPRGSAPTYLGSGSSTHLATGGTLASGKVGFADANATATASTRNYDNFWAAASAPDAAVFGSKQAEIRYDSYLRQDSAGTVWADKTVEGGYLTLPPSGREGRSAELVIRTSRSDPATGTDPSIGSLAGTVYARPGYLTVPGS